MHVCGGCGSVYEFSYLNGLNTCHHMICSNCTASIRAAVVFCCLCICLFANSLNSLSTVELTLFEVSGDFSDMKLVTGHLFKRWGAMAHQKNGTTSSCCSSKGQNVRGEDGRSDTFILTMWNAVFFFLNVAKFKTDWADLPVSGEKGLDLSRCVSITGSELWWSLQDSKIPHPTLFEDSTHDFWMTDRHHCW